MQLNFKHYVSCETGVPHSHVVNPPLNGTHTLPRGPFTALAKGRL
jgi:hypothetical protein